MGKIILLAIELFDRWGDANALEDTVITRLSPADSDFDTILYKLNENRDKTDQISPSMARNKIIVYDMSDFMEDWNDTDDHHRFLNLDEYWLTYVTIK